MNTPTTYPKPMIALHWAVAALTLTTYLSGGHPTREGWIGELHVACGLLVFVLLLLRLPLRLALRRRLPPHNRLPLWQQRAAAAVQWALYGCMFAVPLFGWLALAEETAQFTVFGIAVPLLNGVPEDIGEVHEALANLFISLAFVHAAAALLHHFVLKDGVLNSMRWR